MSQHPTHSASGCDPCANPEGLPPKLSSDVECDDAPTPRDQMELSSDMIEVSGELGRLLQGRRSGFQEARTKAWLRVSCGQRVQVGEGSRVGQGLGLIDSLTRAKE